MTLLCGNVNREGQAGADQRIKSVHAGNTPASYQSSGYRCEASDLMLRTQQEFRQIRNITINSKSNNSPGKAMITDVCYKGYVCY